MLEIIFLIWFCQRLAAKAREKNRSGGWGALGAILWVGGEISGAVIGVKGGAQELGLYGYALLGAILGAVIAYVIVASLKPIPRDGDLPTARVL
jgi:uncharacterized membrane protein YeaQ/YmgE (transglycosylase-associated protein family)